MNEATKLVAEFLDSRSEVHTASLAASVKNPEEEILGHLRDLRPLGLDQPYWKRIQTLQDFPHVSGFIEDSDSTTLYIKGAKGQHAVKVYKDGKVVLIEPNQAAKEYLAYCSGQVRSNSTSNMALFDLTHSPGGAHQVLIRDAKITLAPDEFSRLMSGKPLPDAHPLSQALLDSRSNAKVLFSDPFMQKPGAALTEADQFAFNLQKAYPKVPIYRDPFSVRTDALVRQLNRFSVSGPSDIVAVVADDSFKSRPKDYNLIRDLEKELEKAHIRVVSYRAGTQMASVGKGKGLIVITAHSNEDLATFVHELGRQGAFEGNYVLFNSCETPLSRQLITEINTRYRAVATFAHQGAVGVNDLDGFMTDFADAITRQGRSNFRDLVLEQLHSHRLNGIWTICRLIDGSGITREDV
jgi:hypothetical protein